ncbi:hypothetical protein [Leifsonia sp. TF02-11]|uniref:hypothetical protein n=1 Tax=Leifsonia sp. TF02-11 TaxID=2815212 RepID=UPI001AA0B74A|nr:hypothetical protein [Leifsonia sp. TF02-11]MBO1740828.1 hypothetical protein [Leifsonia sp. TF02-11]
MDTPDVTRWAGLRRPGLHLLWAVPGAVLLSLPLMALAGLAWGAIGGCGDGPLNTHPDTIGLGIACCVGAAALLMLPLAIIPWMRNVAARLLLAALTGLAYGAAVAALTHSPCL